MLQSLHLLTGKQIAQNNLEHFTVNTILDVSVQVKKMPNALNLQK